MKKIRRICSYAKQPKMNPNVIDKLNAVLCLKKMKSRIHESLQS